MKRNLRFRLGLVFLLSLLLQSQFTGAQSDLTSSEVREINQYFASKYRENGIPVLKGNDGTIPSLGNSYCSDGGYVDLVPPSWDPQAATIEWTITTFVGSPEEHPSWGEYIGTGQSTVFRFYLDRVEDGFFGQRIYFDYIQRNSVGLPVGTVNNDYTFVYKTPAAFDFGSDQEICSGESALLTLNGSEAGMEYFLINSGGSQVGFPISGTGNAINFSVSNADTYTVEARNISENSCSNSMNGSATVVVNALPSASASNGGDVCLAEDFTLIGDPDGMTSYVWTNTDGDIVGSTQDLTLSSNDYGTGSHTFTLTVEDVNTCQNTDQTTVTVNSIPTVTLSYNAPVCVGGNLTITASASGGSGSYGNYTWTKDGVLISGETGGTLVINPASITDAGRYGAIVADNAGCSSLEGFVDVTIQTLPTPTINGSATSGTTEMCQGETLTLTGGGGASGAIYEWTLPDMSTVLGEVLTINNIASTVPTGEVYTLKIIEGTCEESLDWTVVVNPTPNVTLSSDQTNDEFCPGTDVTFTAGGASEYIFYINNTEVRSRSNVNTYTTNTLVNGDIVTVEGFDTNYTTDCSLTVDLTVTVFDPPIVAPSFDPTCDGGDLQLYANRTNGTGPFTFAWSHETIGAVSGDENPFIASADKSTYDGNYTVVVTDGNSCTHSATVNVVMNTLPIPTINGDIAITTTELCDGDGLSITGGGGTSYSWLLPDASTVSGSVLNIPTTVKATHEGVYTLTVDDGTCINTLDHNVVINSNPVVTLTSDQPGDEFCVGTNVTFTAGGADEYIFYKNAIDPANIVRSRGTGNTYQDATLVNGDVIIVQGFDTSSTTDCSGTDNVTVTVNEVIASISISSPGSEICAGTPVTFNASAVKTPSDAGAAFNYDFHRIRGASDQSMQDGSSSTYTDNALEDGDVIYVVITETNSGCSDNSNNVVMSVNANPVITLTADANPICADTDVTFTADVTNASANVVPANYEFFINNVSQQSGASSTFTTNTLVDGDLVYVTVVTTNSCQASSAPELAMIVNSLPIPTLSGEFNPCVNSSEIYTTDAGYSNYIWNVTGGSVTDGGNGFDFVEITWNTTGAQTVSVSYETPEGCTSASPTVQSVTVNSLPTILLNGDTGVCINGIGTYSTDAGMTNYDWNISGGTIQTDDNNGTITVLWNVLGNGSVSVNYDNANGCSASSPASLATVVHDLPNPTIVDGSNDVCLNSIEQYSTQGGYVNYDWNVVGGTIIPTGNPEIIQVEWTSIGLQSVSVNYETVNGNCSAVSPALLEVQVNDLPVPNIAGPNDICQNSTGNVYTTESGMSGYVWSITGGSIDSGNGTESVTVTWNASGEQTINVTYIDANGCEPADPSSYLVNVNELPVPTITGAATVCNGITESYSTESGMTNYVWTLSSGGSITSGQNTESIVVDWASNGTHTLSVTYTDGNSCDPVTATSTTITVVDLPTPTISGDDTVCEGHTITYTTQAGATNYDWQIVGGTILPTTQDHIVDVIWTTGADREISVNYELASCPAATPFVLPVTVNPIPTVSLSGPTEACLNTIGHVYATESGENNYQWSVIGGTITAGAGTNQITVTWDVVGQGSVEVNYDNSSGCNAVDPTRVDVTVHPLPVPTITGNTTVCNTYSEVYSTESGMTNYNWIITGGAIISGDGTNEITVQWNTLGTNTITLSYTDPNLCDVATPTLLEVTVQDTPVPTINGPQNVCNNNIEVYSTEAGYQNYLWTVFGGTIISGDGTEEITVSWESAGSQQVTVNYEFTNGCSAPTETIHNVTVNPLSGVTLSATPGLSVLAGTEITFEAAGIDVVNYVYKVNGVEDTSHDGSDTYLWTPVDENDDQTVIRVIAETSTGCKDSTELIVNVFEGLLPYDVVASATEYCGDGSETSTGISIYLSGAQIGITYDLVRGSDNSVVSSIAFDGSNNVVWDDVTGTETYKVEAYNPSVPADRIEMNNQITITRNELPVVYDLSPAIIETTCTNGSDVTLSGSEIDVEYFLMVNGATIATQSGDGNTLNFGPQTVVGVYTILAINTVTGCTSVMNNQYEIDVTYSGNTYEIYTDANTDPRDGTYCVGGSGVNIYLSGADDGITYRLYLDGNEIQTEVGVAGSVVDFGLHTAEGTYTVAVEEGGCYFPMDEYVLVTIQPLPTAYTLMAGNNIPSYCPGGAGVKLLLDNQDAGVRYTLYKDGVFAEDVLSNTTGTPLEFVGDYTIGIYTVTANVEGLTCEAPMANSLEVTENILPEIRELLGDTSFCEGGGVAQLYLNNPESDVDYELMLESNPTGDFGTISGAQIIWTVGAEGLYTVRAVKKDINIACEPTIMGGAIDVTMTNLPEDRTLTVNPGTDCSLGTVITIPNSEMGITYVLINISTDMPVPGYEVIGNGGSISFAELFDSDGYYRVEAYNGTCMRLMTNDTDESPLIHVEIPGVVGKQVVDYVPSGPICVGSGSIIVRVNTPEADVDYVLYRLGSQGDSIAVDTLLQPHTTDPINFADLYAEGTYMVIGYDDVINDFDGCNNEMLNRVDIFYNPLPKAFRLYGAEKYCTLDPAILTLDGSEFNYEYILLRNDGNGNVPIDTKYGTGEELEFIPISDNGSYTVYSMSPDGCTSSMRDTVNISEGVDILEQTVIDGNGFEYCLSEGGVTIQLTDQQTDVLYIAVDSNGEVAAEALGSTPGSPIDLGPLTDGKYAIWGTYNEFGCRTLMNNTDSVQIIGIAEPESKIVTSDAYSVCGSVGTTIRLAESQVGIEYYIDNGTTQRDTLMGDGSDLSWSVTESGLGQITYQVIAIANTTCNKVMGTLDITFKDGPSPYTMFAQSNGIQVSDTARYCANGAGVEIGVNSTEDGIAYILYKDFTDDIGYISGDGSNRLFSGYFMGAESDTVEYSVRAVNIDTGCEVWWSDTIQVIEDALPTVFDLEMRMGNGVSLFDCTDICQGQVSIDSLVLNGSELGVSYELLLNNTPINPAVDSVGTAYAINYGPRDLAGYYTVQAVSDFGCVSMMNGMVQLYQEPLIAINDTLMVKSGLVTDSIDVWANDIKDEQLLDKLGENIAFELLYLSASGDFTQDVQVTTDYGNSVTIDNRGKLEFKKSPTFYGRDTVRYIVRNTDYTERIDTANVYFFVGNIDVNDDNSILIPNAFSPNNDGINDVFEIDGEFKAQVAESKLEVYNRWGTVVYRSKGKQYDNSWDGKSNAGAMVSLGTNLPDGTYFYVFNIKINNSEAGSTTVETREYNGSIELRR